MQPITLYYKKIPYFGYKECPNWLKKKYYEVVKGICQQCKKHFNKLEPHRIKRGNKGGLYTVLPLNHKKSNIKVICSKCHKEIHSYEFAHISRGY